MKSALLISPFTEDHRTLRQIFTRRNWKLSYASTFAAAAEMIESRHVSVIMVERELPLGTWQDALTFLQQTDSSPLVIVVSRVADERFWAEVLNVGGHDVLATPFRAQEVEWALESAWLTLLQHPRQVPDARKRVRHAAHPRQSAHSGCP
jgi:DNA-binding response OmpR family regulator